MRERRLFFPFLLLTPSLSLSLSHSFGGSSPETKKPQQTNKNAHALFFLFLSPSSLIDEYFDSGDVAEAAASLAELGAPAFDSHFVKRLVGAALDRGAREREAASVLLSALSGAAVPVAALERGFWDLAAAADDLELDVPGKDE